MNDKIRKIYQSSKTVQMIFFIPKQLLKYYREHIISDKSFIKYQYKKTFNTKLDLKNPKKFTEKIQWLKLYDKNPLYTIWADKHKNRSFVEKRIGSEYLIPLVFATNNPNDIPFDNLPSEYIIKTNHTSGYNMIFRNGKISYFSKEENFNQNRVIRILESWLKINVFYKNREWEYRNIKPMIIIEELLHDESGNEVLNDYKIHCFNGVPTYIQTIFDRFNGVKENWFDSSWNLLDLYYYSPIKKQITKPKNLENLLNIASKLSEGINYVRVDLYSIKGKIFFGELTFHPYSGLMKFKPAEWDYKLGQYIKLPINEQ
jgi:hypothetical protein